MGESIMNGFSGPRSIRTLSRYFPRTVLCLALSALVLISGCSQTESSSTKTSPSPPPPQSNVTGAAGAVNGGQVPITGAVIQLYAVGTTGDGSAATPLLTGSVTSDAYGGFSLADKYTCPSPAALVYLTATGGTPSLASGTNNSGIALMAALGPCGTINSSTFIQLNELTTVASVFALAPYMTTFDHLGHGPDDIGVFNAAFTSVNELVNTSTGTIPGPTLPAGYEVPTTQINTIADILASCVDSTGGVAGDSSPCGKLFQNTGGSTTTNTITAALQMAQNPATNTTQLFSLISPSSPFQPVLDAAPASFTAAIVPPGSAPSTVPAPVITTGGQTAFPITVSISDSLGGASIHYTIDGSTPTASSPLYTAPLSITATTTVNAIATAAGYTSSPVASSLVSAAPVTPVPVITTSDQSAYPIAVSITDSLSGANIYYTTDGSAPTASSLLYTAPLSISTPTTVNAIAIASGYTNSPIASKMVTVLPVVPSPAFTPLAGNTFPLSVSLSDTLTGSRIYYTTDGSTPTTASTLYTDTFVLPAATTVSAIAAAPGYANSPVVTTTYGYVSPAYTIKTINPCDQADASHPQCGPDTLAINSITNTIYVSDTNVGNGDSNLTIIDGSSDTVSGFVNTQAANNAITVDPVANNVYIGTDSGMVVVNGTTHAVAPFPLNAPKDSNPWYFFSILFNASAHELDITAGRDLIIADTTTGDTKYVISVGASGGPPFDIDPVRNHVYVGGQPNLLNIDANTGTIVDAFTIQYATAVAFNPANDKLYAAIPSLGNGTLLTYNTATLSTSSINNANGVVVIAVNNTTNTIYCANAQNLYVIDGTNDTLKATVPLGSGAPFRFVQLLVDSGLNRIYVLGQYETSTSTDMQTNLSVLDGTTNTLTLINAALGQGVGALNPVTHKIYITDNPNNLINIITPK
ncbi:MAG TPA: chitobiase/beta-hexosaminidase C-terminal domain-containing protein [Edaphobacter sp.]|nr:chitobiase/beta-hexosaminidase C-terminal domain-containing protein [Edaphobacter sp.]